jgi:hypothetical protein
MPAILNARLGLCAMLALAAGCGQALPAANPAPAPSSVELKRLKYGELCSAVRGLRGKVVVVDIWAEY